MQSFKTEYLISPFFREWNASGWLTAFVCLWTFSVLAETTPRAEGQPVILSQFHGPLKAGYLQLNWALPPEQTLHSTEQFELVSSRDPSFAESIPRYRGPDRGSFISGLLDGEYYFRVRVVDDAGAGPWSEPVSAIVEHHSLRRAFILFGIGAAVFVATVLVILIGNARTRHETVEKT